MDEKLAGWTHPESSCSQLSVWVDIRDKWCHQCFVPVLFNFFISDTERLCTPSASVQETPSRGVMLTPLKDRFQKDLDKLMKKTHVNLRRFSEVRCKALHLSQSNSGINSGWVMN